MMKRFLEQFNAQLGWQGVAGVVLLVLAGVFSVLALEPLEQEIGFMRNRLENVRSNVAIQHRTSSSGDRQKELGMFFDSLPTEEDVTDILAKVYAVAEVSGLGFKQAEYHLEDKDNPRMEYRITFPVQGDYGKVRYFVSRVLAEYPAISLDQINFQRGGINDPSLKAEIRLTLFLRPSVLALK